MFSVSKISKLLSRSCSLYCRSLDRIYQRPFYLSPPISCYSVQVENRINEKLLCVKWEDGQTTNYPHIYLRDNCPCPSCYDPQVRQRTISNAIYDDYINATIKTAYVDQDKDEIHVEWINDGQHTSSIFQLDWLKNCRFASQDEIQQPRINRSLWNSDTRNNIPRFDFNQVMNDRLQLYQWLRSLLKHGIAIIENVLPNEIGQVRKLANKIAYLRPCCYGDEYRLESSGDATTIGYQTGTLALHCDLVYYSNIPGIVLLHSIKTVSRGGESLFSDGFKAAQLLKESHPQYFEILKKYPLQHQDIGRVTYDFHQMALHPVIREYHNGEIKQVCYGDHSRASMLQVPHDEVSTFYMALLQFLKYLYHPDNLIELKIKPGSLIATDNHRVFHGRRAYVNTPDNRRLLESGLLDWEEATSYMRIVERDYNMNYLTPSL